LERQWLINLRNALGLTQEQVADEANIKRPYYTMIENGTRRPSVDVAKRIASVLNFKWTIFFNQNGIEVLHDESTAPSA
jgi:putative transcriptional regulator